MSNTIYLGYNFKVQPLQPGTEILIAELGYAGFESFVETEYGVTAYIQKEEWNENILDDIYILNSEEYKITYDFNDIEQTNWNAEWEKNFKPIVVDDLVTVRAPFHDKPNTKYDLIIEPKMSFGTGHHETTFMMIEYMRDINFSNQVIADIGSGTGILAILAEKLGAKEILATDNDPIAVENCIENVQSNSCQNIQVTDDHQVLKNEHYNVILANINQNALMHYKSSFYEALTSKGVIILSGILKERIDEIVEVFEMVGFSKMDHKEKGEWVAIWLNKNE